MAYPSSQKNSYGFMQPYSAGGQQQMLQRWNALSPAERARYDQATQNNMAAMAGGGGGYNPPIPQIPGMPGNGMAQLPGVNPLAPTGNLGNLNTLLGGIFSRFYDSAGWRGDDRGPMKSELENFIMPMMQMMYNQQGAQFEQGLGRFNAYEQALLNRNQMGVANWQQMREDEAMRLGQQRWQSEFGEAGRQFDVGTQLAREAGQREMDIAGAQDALARWQTAQEMGDREAMRRAEAEMQQAGFGQERWMMGQQREESAAERALKQQMQQAGFGQERWALNRELGFQGRENAAERALRQQMQEAGFGQERWALNRQLGQEQRQFNRSMTLQERQNQQRYGTGGLEDRALRNQMTMAAEDRALQERMQGAGFRQERSLFEDQQQLERERMASQEQQARWSNFGRSQTPNTTWARNWG